MRYLKHIHESWEDDDLYTGPQLGEEGTQLDLFKEQPKKKRYVLREPKVDEDTNKAIESIIDIFRNDEQIEIKEDIRANTMRYEIEPVIKVIFGYAATTDHFMQVCKNVRARLNNEYVKNGMLVVEQERYKSDGGVSVTSIDEFKPSKNKVVKCVKLTIINRSK